MSARQSADGPSEWGELDVDAFGKRRRVGPSRDEFLATLRHTAAAGVPNASGTPAPAPAQIRACVPVRSIVTVPGTGTGDEVASLERRGENLFLATNRGGMSELVTAEQLGGYPQGSARLLTLQTAEAMQRRRRNTMTPAVVPVAPPAKRYRISSKRHPRACAPGALVAGPVRASASGGAGCDTAAHQLARAAPASQLQHSSLHLFGYDLDMLWCLMPVAELPSHTLLDYIAYKRPIWKVYPERPQHIQIATYPMGVYAPVDDGADVQALKQRLADELYSRGVEQPFPTEPWESALSRGTLKVPSHAFKVALQSCGVDSVFVGRFGMKQYLGNSYLRGLRDVPHVSTCVDVGQMMRDPEAIWLFGMRVNDSGTYFDNQNSLKWRVYPLVPDCQFGSSTDNGWIFGTLECKPLHAAFGNDEGKLIQLYSLLHHTRLALTSLQPNFPTRMFHMQDKLDPLREFTALLHEHLPRSGGGRKEVRSQRVRAATADECMASVGPHMKYIDDMFADGHIRLMRLPHTEYWLCVDGAWRRCLEPAPLGV